MTAPPDRRGLLSFRLGPILAAAATIVLLLGLAEYSIGSWIRNVAPSDDRSAVIHNLYDSSLDGKRAVVLIGGSAVDEAVGWSLDPSMCPAGKPPVLRKLTFGGQSLAVSLGILDHLKTAPGSLVLLHVNYFRMGGSPEALHEELVAAALPLPSSDQYDAVLRDVGQEPGEPAASLLYHAPFLYNYLEVRLWPLRRTVRRQLSVGPFDVAAWGKVLASAFEPGQFRPTAVRFDDPEPLAAKQSSLAERLADETAALDRNVAFNLAILRHAREIAKKRGYRLVLIDTPQDPALFADTRQIARIYDRAVQGYEKLGLDYVDLRYDSGLPTDHFRDLVHFVTRGRAAYAPRWNELLKSRMSDYCSAEKADG